MRKNKNLFKTVFFISLFLTFAITVLSATVVAAKYPDPSETITFIIPYAVGGGYDSYTRLLVPYLAKELNTRVVIRNMPGAQGVIALKKIYNAKPNGYTIGIWNPGFLVWDKDIQGKVNFDTTTFTFLYRITNEPRLVIIKADGPIKDFKDLLKKGRSPNFKLLAAHAGGTGTLDALLIVSEWGMKAEGVPYRGGAQNRLAVMRGDVHFCVSGLGSGIDALSTGRVKFALLLNDKPMTQVPEAQKWIKEFPQLKNVPIPSDLGLKQLSYVSKSARCIFAPPRLPKDIKATLENALGKVISNQKLRKLGLKSDRPFGLGQRGDAYTEKIKKDKKTLVGLKHLLK